MANYVKLFNPESNQAVVVEEQILRMGDRVEVPYIYTDQIILAVNLALATRRPLLVRGSSGVGKSALARDIARRKRWHCIEIQMTSRTEAQDLLWRFDALRRLQDAQLGKMQDDSTYISPGPLWFAFDRQSAEHQRNANAQEALKGSTDKMPMSVILIDEIDKSDPDIPNNLLTVLGNLAFEVEPLGFRVETKVAPLIVITTNDERDLAPAFVRRCIEPTVENPDASMLRRIGAAHFPGIAADLLSQIVDRALSAASMSDIRVSTAEFLDLLQACVELGVAIDDPEWASVMTATFAKPKGRGNDF